LVQSAVEDAHFEHQYADLSIKSCHVVAIDRMGAVICTVRKDGKMLEIPGGMPEGFDQTPWDTAFREFSEEVEPTWILDDASSEFTITEVVIPSKYAGKGYVIYVALTTHRFVTDQNEDGLYVDLDTRNSEVSGCALLHLGADPRWSEVYPFQRKAFVSAALNVLAQSIIDA